MDDCKIFIVFLLNTHVCLCKHDWCMVSQKQMSGGNWANTACVVLDGLESASEPPALFWVWCADDTRLHIWAMQMGTQCTRVLVERGWDRFSCPCKPADCGYGKYIPIMWSLWSQRPCCFAPSFVFTVCLHIKRFSPGWLTTPVLWQRFARVVSTQLYFQALWCLCLASKFPSL